MASTSKPPDEGPHDWEQHKEIIRNLYIVKNLTLQRLIQEMKTAHAFNATKAQYERRLTRWGFKKNRKKREWIEIAEKVIGRLNEDKDLEVVIDDQIIPSKKLKKEVRRYGRDLIKSFSTQGTVDRCLDVDEVCCPSFAADNAACSSIAIVRSPKLQLGVLQTPSDVGIPFSSLLDEASSFLRARHSTQKAGLRASMMQLLAASSPSNKRLKAAMVPSEYSKLMGTVRSGQDRLSKATNLKIMSTAIFLFRNSLNEGSFDLGHQMFTWFQANYDARMFKFLAGRKDPLASAILEKLFRQAVWEGDSDMVRELLLTGIDPNQRWRVFCFDRRIHTEPKSAIQIACEKKDMDIAKLLLNAGANIPAETDPKYAPLCCLLEGSSPLDLDLVKKLIDATPANTLRAYSGCLASTVRRKDLKLIELLIEAGVGDHDMYRFSCSQQGCTSNSSKRNASLHCPTHTITFPVLKKLFIARADRFLAFQQMDFTHLQWADSKDFRWTDCMRFFSDLFDSLLHQRNQQAVNLASEINTTVLATFLRACRKDFLVKRGAAVLFDAILNTELDTVRLLLRYGVDCNLLVNAGQRKTCLAAAIEAHDCEVLKMIIDAGVNVNGVVEQDRERLQTAFPQAYTALVNAIRWQNLNAIDMLLEAGAEVNPTETPGSPVGPTPLQAAVEQGDLGLVQKLLDLGANANEEPNPYGGYTALQITASKGLIGVASLLLERGADVNAKGARKGGRTALEAAAENDRIDMVQFLINSGAHIIGPDDHQYWQARTLALNQGHFAVCKLLDALYAEKSGGQSSDQVLSSADVDFDFSSGIPTSYDLSDEFFDLSLIEKFGEANDNQSGSANSVESWAWPLSSIPDFSLNDIPDEWFCEASPSGLVHS